MITRPTTPQCSLAQLLLLLANHEYILVNALPLGCGHGFLALGLGAGYQQMWGNQWSFGCAEHVLAF